MGMLGAIGNTGRGATDNSSRIEFGSSFDEENTAFDGMLNSAFLYASRALIIGRCPIELAYDIWVYFPRLRLDILSLNRVSSSLCSESVAHSLSEHISARGIAISKRIASSILRKFRTNVREADPNQSLPLATNYYEVILISLDTFGAIEKKGELISELKRATTVGGQIFINTFLGFSLYDRPCSEFFSGVSKIDSYNYEESPIPGTIKVLPRLYIKNQDPYSALPVEFGHSTKTSAGNYRSYYTVLEPRPVAPTGRLVRVAA